MPPFGHVPIAKVREMRGQESNLRTRGSKPRISTSRNYPAIGEGRVGLEPTIPIHRDTCFRGRFLIRPDDFQFHSAAVAGLEPAFVSLTGSRLTIGPHRNMVQSAWSELNRRFRAPQARGPFVKNRARLYLTLIPRAVWFEVIEKSSDTWKLTQ